MSVDVVVHQLIVSRFVEIWYFTAPQRETNIVPYMPNFISNISHKYTQITILHHPFNDISLYSQQVFIFLTKMNSLFYLPKSILMPIFQEWLIVKEFMHLDTAFTNCKCRDIFLNSIEYKVSCNPPSGQICVKFIDWCALRHVGLASLNMSGFFIPKKENPQFSLFMSVFSLMGLSFQPIKHDISTDYLNFVITHLVMLSFPCI